MKDFYDLKVLSQEFRFEGNILADAIKATFTRRGTGIPNDPPLAFTEEFSTNPDKQLQWQAFLRNSKLEDTAITLSEIIHDIQRFLMPPLNAVAEDEPFAMTWSAGGAWKPS